MEPLDYEVFKGVGFKDLCQNIYQNQLARKEQIDVLISELRPLIKSVNDAMVVVPLIKGYMDTGNTNDDHLVRLAAIIQKLMTAQAGPSGDLGGSVGLTEEEKKQIMAEIEGMKNGTDVDTTLKNLNDIKNTIQPSVEVPKTKSVKDK
jgi:hypothetical protein